MLLLVFSETWKWSSGIHLPTLAMRSESLLLIIYNAENISKVKGGPVPESPVVQATPVSSNVLTLLSLGVAH